MVTKPELEGMIQTLTEFYLAEEPRTGGKTYTEGQLMALIWARDGGGWAEIGDQVRQMHREKWSPELAGQGESGGP